MAKEYKLMKDGKVLYVLTPSRQAGPSANFLGTGLALSGIIKDRRDLTAFKDRQVNQFLRNRKNNETLLKVLSTTKWRKNKQIH